MLSLRPVVSLLESTNYSLKVTSWSCTKKCQVILIPISPLLELMEGSYNVVNLLSQKNQTLKLALDWTSWTSRGPIIALSCPSQAFENLHHGCLVLTLSPELPGLPLQFPAMLFCVSQPAAYLLQDMEQQQLASVSSFTDFCCWL